MSAEGLNFRESRSTAAFATTHWSVVLAAKRADSPQAQGALADLCRTYWYPLYAYVRRRGYSPDDAQDLTQGFFERFLAGSYLDSVAREKGKFRSFLLASLNHFLADAWDRANRRKRGGGARLVSFDQYTAEERYRLEPVEEAEADKLYERRWAMTLLEQVLQQLEMEFRETGKAAQFEALHIFLLGEKGAVSYAQTAADLGMSESAVGVAIHRMRQRYGELFRAAIANTVSDPAEVDEEINHLLRVLSG